MEFKVPYLEAMRQQAPQMFNELRRSGAMEAHLADRSNEAHRLFEQLTAGAAKTPSGEVRDPAVRNAAEQQVLETLIDFPPPATGESSQEA